MGHREDLLAGAKRCIYEKGYGRTTARDIVAASGTNLASIGYHYGSKEALLNDALMDAIREWGEELGRALSPDLDVDLRPLDRFEAVWTRIVELFGKHRPLWLANFEVFAQVEHVPEMRATLVAGMQQAREGLVGMFLREPDQAVLDDHAQRAVGAFSQALVLGVMAQWLVDPGRAPTGHDLAAALRAIIDSHAGAPAAAANAAADGDRGGVCVPPHGA